MPDAIDFLKNEDFHKLPLGDRLEVLRKDSNFSALSPKDQGEIVAHAQQKLTPGQPSDVKTPKDAGFINTLGKDIASIPGALMATGTGEKGDVRPPGIIPAMAGAQHEQFQKGREAFAKGDYIPAIGHTVAGALPVVGPLAAQAGEEFGSGQPGQGSAHAFEALAPSGIKAVGEIPRVKSAVKVGGPDIAKGTLKAGAGVGLYEAGRHLGAPSVVDYLVGSQPIYSGLRQAGQGLVNATKELFKKGVTPEAPAPKIAPPKGPSIGDLKTAVKNGIITPEQFDARIDQMSDITDEAKTLHKGNVRSTLKADQSPGVEPPKKPLSVNQLQSLVKMGKLTVGDFGNELTKLNYGPEERAHLTDLLVKSMKDESDAAAQKAAQVSTKGIGPVESPKTLNIGQLERLVKIGRKTPEEFQNHLITDLKYKPEDAEHLTELLKQSMKEDEEVEEEPLTPPKKETAPEKKTPVKKASPKVNKPPTEGPLTDEERQAKIDASKKKVEAPKVEAPKKITKTKPESLETQLEKSLKVSSPKKKPNLQNLFDEADKREPRSPLPGETPEKSTKPPKNTPGTLVGRTTGKEIPEQRGGYKAGFGIYEVPVEKIVGTEDISSNKAKLADAKKYAKAIKGGSEAPPLWGYVDAEGNVKVQGARRLEAQKSLKQKTIKVAIGQDYRKPRMRVTKPKSDADTK